MGPSHVPRRIDDRQLRAFTKALLDDVHALERMLDAGQFESRPRRIGAEQEMFLVDASMRPAPVATQVLAAIDDPRLTTELARFNLEANLTPKLFGGSCLRELERELAEVVAGVRSAARDSGADVLLTGILPTLTQADLSLENMTPSPRYRTLNDTITRLRGGAFDISIKGIDELDTRHENVMLESCNTSFQIHLQVGPDEFARLYNAAQAVTAPVLAAAVNSPMLFGRRLWHETRVALFQHSTDARSDADQARGQRPRVSFGDAWIDDSALEIFREDIARFRVVLPVDLDEDPLAELEAGRAPPLSALRLHNGTIWRWNRPCYGIKDGVAHLRIENRVLPAGPTTLDEVANAAFFYGLMVAVLEEYGEIDRLMPFDDAKLNFFAAARRGLQAQLAWVGGETHTASRLILDHLLPMARAGLESATLDADDIARYLDVVEERVHRGQTGARWILQSMAQMGSRATADIRQRALTATMLELQTAGEPVHTWPVADVVEEAEWEREGYRAVGQFMSTDLFTVRPADLIDLAASVMDWERVRHIPVEDDEGRLVGILSSRAVLRVAAHGLRAGESGPIAVESLMHANPVTVAPETRTLDAIRLMREHKVGCLPVVANDRLVGIISERDLLVVAAKLLARHLEGKPAARPPKLTRLPRIIGDCAGDAPGPTVVAIGGLHGNEPAGVRALETVLDTLARGSISCRGRFWGVRGNCGALAGGTRFVERDLNRGWGEASVAALRNPELPPRSAEDRECRELLELFDQIESWHRANAKPHDRPGPVVLDLHTASGVGSPFASIPGPASGRLATILPVPVIVGFDRVISGAMLSYLANRGFLGLAVEGGQHDAPETVANLIAAIWLVLVEVGVVEAKAVPDLSGHRARLEATVAGLPRAVQIRHRHLVRSGDGFAMQPGFRNLEPVTAGTVLARDRKGPIAAPCDGRVLLPLYQGEGEDGFFIATDLEL